MGFPESPEGYSAKRPAAGRPPYDDHLGTPTAQRRGEGGGAKIKSGIVARLVVEFALRSLAPQDHGHRGTFHRGHPFASGAPLWLPQHSGHLPDSIVGHACSRRPATSL